MTTLRTFFKSDSSKALGFGIKCQTQAFNYLSPGKGAASDKAEITKHLSTSYQITADFKYPEIDELKVTNQGIITWEDYWINEKGILVDPMISSINLQKNSLISFNCNLSRPSLKKVNLESNSMMVGLILSNSPNLEYLNISNCSSLTNINLGNNRKIGTLLARNCNLSSEAQERLLRDFRPTVTAGPSNNFSMFRKEYETLLDLRGTAIDWSNRNVASKIRLLICNNWLVLWDNTPPTSIVPPQMYSFFSTNLEDAMIKKYYGS